MNFCKKHNQKYWVRHCPICAGEELWNLIQEKGHVYAYNTIHGSNLSVGESPSMNAFEHNEKNISEKPMAKESTSSEISTIPLKKRKSRKARVSPIQKKLF